MKTSSTASMRSDYTRANYTLKCSECLKEKQASNIEIVNDKYKCMQCLNKEIQNEANYD